MCIHEIQELNVLFRVINLMRIKAVILCEVTSKETRFGENEFLRQIHRAYQSVNMKAIIWLLDYLYRMEDTVLINVVD